MYITYLGICFFLNFLKYKWIIFELFKIGAQAPFSIFVFTHPSHIFSPNSWSSEDEGLFDKKKKKKEQFWPTFHLVGYMGHGPNISFAYMGYLAYKTIQKRTSMNQASSAILLDIKK